VKIKFIKNVYVTGGSSGWGKTFYIIAGLALLGIFSKIAWIAVPLIAAWYAIRNIALVLIGGFCVFIVWLIPGVKVTEESLCLCAAAIWGILWLVGRNSKKTMPAQLAHEPQQQLPPPTDG
jgi:hypothetical protein